MELENYNIYSSNWAGADIDGHPFLIRFRIVIVDDEPEILYLTSKTSLFVSWQTENREEHDTRTMNDNRSNEVGFA